MYKLVILGAGESGTGAALLAKKYGLDVFVSDENNIASAYKEDLIQHGVSFEEGGHTLEKIFSATEIIKSQGMLSTHPLIQKIQETQIPLIDEVEFASRYVDPTAIIIAITGSNGKTTTAYLTHYLLTSAGYDAVLVGNVGKSFARNIAAGKHVFYVLEVSSFQLELCFKFKANIGCLLNITPDHLDRYNYCLQKYIDAKLRILQNMDTESHFIYSQDDPHINENILNGRLPPQCYPISVLTPNVQGVYRSEHALHFYLTSNNFEIPLCCMPLRGVHNQYNVMAAVTVASVLGVVPKDIRKKLPQFKALSHRIEWIASPREVHCYNDSKATNVGAAYASLSSFSSPIIWIAGGLDKGNDYTMIMSLVKKNVKAIICLGKDNSLFVKTFQGLNIPIYETQSMEIAVQKAFDIASPGDTLLLAPACASFDLFKNYEDRGIQFKTAVLKLFA